VLARLTGRTLTHAGGLLLAGPCLGAFDGDADHKQDRGGGQQRRCYRRQPISKALHTTALLT
jgi:hypothetical protein